MAIEHEILPLIDWLLPQLNASPMEPGALLNLFFRVLLVLVLGISLSYMLTSLRYGPGEAFYVVSKVIADAVGRDLPNFSFRRTFAIARLAVQESIRRRVIVAFAVFLVILLFAGWYLDQQNDHPARLYISFVLSAANFLSLGLALFLSTFSLPNDIKNKTIYTVVTKPVRAGEIVLGRILGFAIVGTALLAVTGLVSYVFVLRGLSHQHEVDLTSVTKVEPTKKVEPNEKESAKAQESLAVTGKTTLNAGHRHTFTVDEKGFGKTDSEMGHWHAIETKKDQDGKVKYVVGPHEGMLLARIPHYGKLTFIDRNGNPTKSGISVGQEWTYRGYVEGQSKSAAVWRFTGITPERYPDGLPLETDIRIFRTHKGNIERGILGEVSVHNVDPAARFKRSEGTPFTAVEFELGSLFIPRKLKAINDENKVVDVDLFKDLVQNGQLEIRIRCKEPGQYFGMAQADLYVKAVDASFGQNFVKGYIGLWLQMLIVTSIGVVLSTFLSAPVALLGTLGGLVIGYFGQFIAEVAKGDKGEAEGGGPIEAFWRILTQNNITNPLDIGDTPETIIKGIDWLILWIMQATATLVPNLGSFDATNYVAYGYNIDANLLSQHILTTFAFVLVASIVGYFTLKTREIAA